MDVDYGDFVQHTTSNFKEKAPTWAKNGRRIVYVSDKDGNADIYKMTATGRKKKQLTFDIGDQRAPSCSNSTNEIAFHWWDTESSSHIYVMDLKGENVRKLTSRNFYDRGPNWSPNGERITFNSNRAGTFNIWTMKHDGSDKIQLTFKEARDSAPFWGKTGFSDEWTGDTEIAGKGKRNIAYIGTIRLAEGGALQVEMSWDDGADLDLGILEPDGNLIRWKNPEGFGRHKGDVGPGPGVEIYTLSGAPRGDYLIGAYFKDFPSTAHWSIRWRDGSFEPMTMTP
jgi:dipeptidyl aminopeptidase/acylaminoacyl peptidase